MAQVVERVQALLKKAKEGGLKKSYQQRAAAPAPADDLEAKLAREVELAQQRLAVRTAVRCRALMFGGRRGAATYQRQQLHQPNH